MLWQSRTWLIPAAILACSALIELGGQAVREALRYERAAILADGELWRLLTGHLAHLGWTHLLLNGAGLVLVWCLVAGSLSLAGWALVVLLTIAGIDAGFLLLRPDLAWYVGLSGLLHGLLAAGLVAGFRARPLECVVIGLGLVIKLTWEQLVGPLPGSAETAGGAVIVAAHLYGALGGALTGAVISAGFGANRRI